MFSDVKIVKLKMIDMIDLVNRCNIHPTNQNILTIQQLNQE